jgi:hypothetical protein
MIIHAWIPCDGSNHTGAGSFYGIKTHGSIVTNIAFWFTMLSPLIGLVMALLGASFFSQASF